MQNVVNMLRGYVEISVFGEHPEDWINRQASAGIYFWQMEKEEDGSLTARIDLLDYYKLRTASGGLSKRVALRKRRGIPFFVWHFRKRYVFLAGILLCMFAIYGLSLRIWTLEVVGNKTISDERILRAMEKIGIGIGTPVSGIDFEMLEDHMLMEVGELSWFALNIKGSSGTAEVRERTPLPEVLNEKIPCNVVARKDGLITKITVYEGSARAAQGGTVRAGQILASGIVDTKTGMRFVHARAEAKARTWYAFEVKLPLAVRKKTYTGEIKRKVGLLVGKTRINFYWNGSISFDQYDNIMKDHQLILPGGLALPLTLVVQESRAYIDEPVLLDTGRAQKAAEQSLLRRLQDAVGSGEIVKMETTEEVSENTLTVTMHAECLEDIALSSAIPIGEYIGG